MDATLLHDKLIAGATKHGESDEPDHEVGDLQDVLLLALQLMTARQLATLARKPAVLGVVLGQGPNDCSGEEAADYELDGVPPASFADKDGKLDNAKLFAALFFPARPS